MKHWLSILAFACLAAGLPAQVLAPRIGSARYPDGSLHTVQGLPANMIVADLPLDPAQAASFSDNCGLISQNGVIRLLARNYTQLGEIQAGETQPLLSVGLDALSAVAWLPHSHTLLHWNGAGFDALELAGGELEGTVTDVQVLTAKQARLLVEHADQSVSAVTVSLRSGNLITSELLPGVRGAAIAQDYFIVFAAGGELVADDLHGYRRNVPAPSPDVRIERMSNQWLNLYSPRLRQNWAVHLTQADLSVSELPGLPVQSAHPLSSGAGRMR